MAAKPLTHSFVAVPKSDVGLLWWEVSPFITAALDRDGSDRFRVDEVLKLLLEDKAALWVAWNKETGALDAAVVTEIIHFPRFKECRIWLIGGRNLRQWIILGRDTIEAFARHNQCRLVSGALRRGWVRIGGPGWAETGVMFEKELQ